ncbi:MAG: amino acid ABC transporter substrate-binding protein [Rhodocyclaceae bacterium]
MMNKLLAHFFRLMLLAGLALFVSFPAIADTLQKLRGGEPLVIGWVDNNLPFSASASSEAEPFGFTVDLCKLIAARLAERIGIEEVKVAYQQVTFETRFSALDNNEIDLECASTTVTRARMEKYQFTPAYYVAGVRLLVQRGQGIQSLDDLAGKTVAVVPSTTGETLTRQHNELASLRLDIRSYDTPDLAAEAVMKGEAMAFPFDDILLYAMISNIPGGYDALDVAGRFMSIEPYGLMMRGSDEAFQKLVSSVLAEVLASRDAGQVFERWFDNDELRAPMNRLTKEAFSNPSREPAFP